MPMSMVEMERALKQLRLSGIQASLEARSLQATQGKIPFIEAFGMLLQDEIDRRKSLMIERRYKQSGIEQRKTFDEFDWKFNPNIPIGRPEELRLERNKAFSDLCQKMHFIDVDIIILCPGQYKNNK